MVTVPKNMDNAVKCRQMYKIIRLGATNQISRVQITWNSHAAY